MRLYLLGFSIATLITYQAYAGAWTQDKGKGQIIANAFYYSTQTLFDNQGNKTRQSRYSKHELNPYLEYGLYDGVTIGANLSLQRAHQKGPPDLTNWGLGDSEFFLRTRLWQHEGFVISLEPMFKLPSPELWYETPAIGSRHPDVGIGLSAGYGFSAFGEHHFANLDAGYRYRFGVPENQIKLAGTLGIGINDRWMVMPQVFATYRTDEPNVILFTQSSADDYNLVKLQLSTVYKMNDSLSLQAGAFKHASGKNVGGGDGVLFSVWKQF